MTRSPRGRPGASRGSGPRGRKAGYRKLASAKGTPGKAEGEAWVNRLRRFRSSARQAGWTEERITSVIGRGQGGVAAAENELGLRRRAAPAPEARPQQRAVEPSPHFKLKQATRDFRDRARQAGWTNKQMLAVTSQGLHAIRAEMRKQGW